jgi:large repetitive protein
VILSRRVSLSIVTIVALFMAGMLTVSAATTTLSNTSAIALPGEDAATLYPSTITITGVSGDITDVNVTLMNLNHTYPNDVDVLLVGPGGQNVILMSDVGWHFDISDVSLTIDDQATASLPVDQALTSGIYLPTNTSSNLGFSCEVDSYPAPAPAGEYGANLSVFNGTAANGTWSLFVVDDCARDAGSIAGGWSLEITFDGVPTITVPDDITVSADAGQTSAVVDYPAATANDPEDGTITPDCSPTSGSVFSLGTTTVNCTATDSDSNTASDSFTVTVIDSELPVLTMPANIQVNATGPNGAVVTYTASATDNSGAATVNCVPPSGFAFPVGTTTVNCTAIDGANNSANGSFTVTVLGANDLLAQLRASTIDLVSNSNAERALVATVDQAIRASNSGNYWGTYAALLKYVIQIDSYANSRAVSPVAAQQLLTQAMQVLDASR